MAYKQSSSAVSKNSENWNRNLTDFEKSKRKRGAVSNVDTPLSDRCRIPQEIVIIGRFNTLAESEKLIKNIFKTITKEIYDVWKKLNFSCIAKSSIEKKVEKVITKYDNFLKCPAGKDISDSCNDLFNVTYEKGLRLSE